MEELLTVQLTKQEVNVLLQFIDKSPVTGVQGMRVVLGLDAKVRNAVAGLSIKPKIDSPKKEPLPE